MNGELISVIVPIFNAEGYLKKCLNSIVRQSYKDLEIILIDDGSTDSSGIICDEYGNSDQRVKVVHKINEGVSVARNTALEMAGGRYICFVDSDDWLDPYALENLYRAQQESNADLVCGSVADIKSYKKKNYHIPNHVFQDEEIVQAFLDYYFAFCAPWGKLLKKRIIEEWNFVFNKNIPYGEDTSFNLNYIAKCSCVTSINSIVYFHRNHLEGASNPFKFYEKMNYYMELNFLDAIKFTDTKANDEDERIQLNACFAERYCNHALEHYMYRMNDNRELMNKVKVIISFYTKYIEGNRLFNGAFREVIESNYSDESLKTYIIKWKKKYIIKILEFKLKKFLINTKIIR